ncbi:MAG TPA: sodium:proton antiporter [Tepidisphaeraceae bacterium]|nr:sodium:proton antiporter [Tepidisphaeraceae bacterium]
MFDAIVLSLGAFIILIGLVSTWLERKGLPPTVLALLAGVVLGPAVTGVFDPAATGARAHVLELVTRLSLAIAITSLILFVPKQFARRRWREMVVLVGGSMLLMWVVSTALVYLILGIPFLMAALIGAMLAPTDPVAARPIVEGIPAEEHLPHRLRHALAFESASNDGAAYPLVFLPFLLMTLAPGAAWSHWAVHTLLWEVGGAAVIGVGLGYAAAHLLRAAEARDLIKDEWRLVYTAAVALVGVGGGHLIHVSEFVLVFAAAVAGSRVIGSGDRKDEEHGQEAANRFLSVPIFGLLGTAIPWDGWRDLGWRGAALAGAILLFRRLPAMMAVCPFVPILRRRADTLFVGWFGPIGIATIYYGAHFEQRLGAPLIWHVTSLVICASVLAHGLTATPLTRLYGRVTGQTARNAARRAERAEMAERAERADLVERAGRAGRALADPGRERRGHDSPVPGTVGRATRARGHERAAKPPSPDHDAGAGGGADRDRRSPSRSGRAAADGDDDGDGE